MANGWCATANLVWPSPLSLPPPSAFSSRPHLKSSSFLGRTIPLTLKTNTVKVTLKHGCKWKVSCWFKFGSRGVDAEGAGIYGTQTRDDFDRDDVEQAFVYQRSCLFYQRYSRYLSGHGFCLSNGALVHTSYSWLSTKHLLGQYFNYMGMLAVEGTYDKMEALLSKNIHPVDILLLLASSEGDKPKIEEIMRAGADYTVTDAEGRTALDRAADEEIRNLIANFPR